MEKNFTCTSPKHILAASVLWTCSINIWIKNGPSLKVLFKWINGCLVCNWFHRPLHAIMLNLSCEWRKIMPSPGSLTLLHRILRWDTSLCPSCQRFPPLRWREKRPGLPLPMRLRWVHGLRSLSTLEEKNSVPGHFWAATTDRHGLVWEVHHLLGRPAFTKDRAKGERENRAR